MSKTIEVRKQLSKQIFKEFKMPLNGAKNIVHGDHTHDLDHEQIHLNLLKTGNLTDMEKHFLHQHKPVNNEKKDDGSDREDYPHQTTFRMPNTQNYFKSAKNTPNNSQNRSQLMANNRNVRMPQLVDFRPLQK